MNDVMFLNENGVVITNQNDIYISHLPTVGVDTVSIGTVFLVSKQKSLNIKIKSDSLGYYKLMSRTINGWEFSDEVKNLSSNKKIYIKEEEYNLFNISVSCKVTDADDTSSTTSAICNLSATYDGWDGEAQIALITEFVEANTNEILVKQLISKDIDKYLVNACDCHAPNAENPDLMMYNRKLKEMLMTRTLADGTYNALYNTLMLFGFDNVKVYSAFSSALDSSIYQLKDCKPSVYNVYSSDETAFIETYKKCFDILVVFKMYKEGILKGEHLTDSVTPEFESDINNFNVYPDSFTKNQILDGQIHPLLTALDEKEEGIMTLTGQNKFSEFYDGLEEAYSENDMTSAELKPRFLNEEESNLVQLLPETVPYLNTIDGTATVTRAELQEKTHLIKDILNSSFNIIYNNIMLCGLEDAAYSNNIKLISHTSSTKPYRYDDLSNYTDDYGKYIKIFLTDSNGNVIDKTLDEWLAASPTIEMKEMSLDVQDRVSKSKKIIYFLDDLHNYPSNCIAKQDDVIDSENTDFEYWHFNSSAADMPFISFTNIKADRYKDFNFVEIFAIKSRFKVSEDINENIRYCQERGLEDVYTYSLHDNVGSVKDFILLTDTGTWDIIVNIYNNYREMPLFTKFFSVNVTNGHSHSSVYRLIHVDSVKSLYENAKVKPIYSIYHNEKYIYSYNKKIDEYYSNIFETEKQFLNNMLTCRLAHQKSIDFNTDTTTVSVMAEEYDDEYTITIDMYVDDWLSAEFSIKKDELYDCNDVNNKINEFIYSHDETCPMLVNLHFDSKYPAPQIDEDPKLYMSVLNVRPGKDVGALNGTNVVKNDWIFYSPTWHKVGSDMIEKNKFLYKKNILKNILYIIENKNGNYCSTSSSYRIISEQDELLMNMNTSAMLFSHSSIADAKKIECNYYDTFIQTDISLK